MQPFMAILKAVVQSIKELIILEMLRRTFKLILFNNLNL